MSRTSAISLPSSETLRELFNYNPDTGELTCKSRPNARLHIGDVVGTISGGRRSIRIKNKRYFASRIIWKMVNGVDPRFTIDHKNMNSLDDRIDNLREATFSENNCNTRLRKNNTSGFCGVSWNKEGKMWCAQIRKNGKYYSLGLFLTANQAFMHRAAVACELHGAFAR
jgi:hypothetical protein